MRSKIKYTEQLKDITDYLSPNSLRTKRGIVDFGDVLKFLFGTLTQPDAKAYN
jgi:hypothetical protein